MSEFGSEIAARVGRTTAALHAAQVADDDYLSAVLLGELESLARVAAEHDVDIPGLRESLERYTHPTDLHLPQDARPTVVDLAAQDRVAGEPARRIA